MKKLILIIGASGAGKTTILKNIESKNIPNTKVYYFDDLGVPTTEEMIRDFGSVENWQKAILNEWVRKINSENAGEEMVLLDGSVRPSFVDDACEIVLIDCDDEVREKRLKERGHPELVNENMKNWANYLRTECKKDDHLIIDTSNKDLSDSTEELISVLKLQS